MFNLYDLEQLSQAGIRVEQAERQLQNFRTGFPYLPIVAPAAPGKGIRQLDTETQAGLVQLFDNWSGRRVKFVPASGAATRMFKALLETKTALAQNPGAAISNDSAAFFASLDKFAFYDELKKVAANPDDRLAVLNALLDKAGLNYGNLPKGLLLFHKYAGGARTAFEEHLVEAALYAKDAGNVARLHFTVSPEHRSKFTGLLKKVQPSYEEQFGVTFEITFSEQKKSTDTIAADGHNQPFRNADNSLLFRPGGHGALLENLNALTEDVVFVKNIDNVVTDALKPETVHWKKVLAGLLLQLREQIYHYIAQIENNPDALQLKKIALFLEHAFCITLPEVPEKEYAPLLYAKLNRPLRVCGMVKNVGEPGGGPFIAKDADGSLSLQIAESVQLDLNDPEVQKHFNAATHFNPVDLVCSFRDYKGGKFDLLHFRDPATGFISTKSKDGRTLKAQELPGLWNGAMSNWNTVFVEVPLATFNPVKTVLDLLRKEHQSELRVKN
ncbi:MAG: DUF4301 family protein [Prevotellaceae bacterium]|jgi:hypothetical protein|nr:DUF4301 family protein [Prevotellaceae bacterium]